LPLPCGYGIVSHITWMGDNCMTAMNYIKEGDRYHYVVATGAYRTHVVKDRGREYQWRCDCGNITWRTPNPVRLGEMKTCGQEDCKYHHSLVYSVKEGDRFGHLMATGNHQKGTKDRKGYAEFKCDCGSITLKRITTVKKGDCINCADKDCSYGRRVTHGKTTKDSYSDYKKEYRCWVDMKARCNNENSTNYHNYGARGIAVCKEFESFEGFFEHVGMAPSPEHSIDRIDNDGNYEIGNVRWADRVTQCLNKRTRQVVKRDKEIIRLKKELKALKMK